MEKILCYVYISIFCVSAYAITFDYVADFASENTFYHACTADFNRDGKIDIAIASYGRIEIYGGTGGDTPYFEKKNVLNVPGYLQYIISDDFNRDGIPDIAVTSYQFPDVFYVLLGDGNFSFQVSYQDAPGSYLKGIVSGDFNRDGIPDMALVSYDFYFFCYLGNGDGTFNLASTNYTSYVSLYLTAGDFDNDGILDVAVSGYFNSVVHIFKGKGDGTFHSPQDIYVSNPWYISKGDFNRDGKLDLVVASRGGSGRIAILIGNGDCTFKAPTYYNTGGEPWGIDVSDFDGDGISDIAVVNSYSKTLKVLKGKGDGTFQSDFSYTSSQTPQAVVAGDFTKDGKNDIALILGQGAIIFENSTQFKETGIFSEPVHYEVGQNPRAVITADFNNDGILDLAVANNDSMNVSVLIGKSDGSFFPAVNYDFQSGFVYEFRPSDLVAGDFNRDGKIDIAVSNYTGYTYGVMLNNGDGTFTVSVYFATGASPFDSINCADFNRDGKLDILITTSLVPNGGFLSLYGSGNGTFGDGVFYTRPSAWRSAIGDFDMDGILDLAITCAYAQNIHLYKGWGGDFTFLNTINSGNGPVQPVFSDFNSDGNPDIAVCDWTDQNISVFLGDGHGAYNISSTYQFAGNPNPYDIVAGDFNRDGKIDLIVACVSSTNLVLLAGNNDGSFTLAGEFSVGNGYPRALCTGDFDRNGTIDIAVVRGNPDGLSIFYNLQIDKGDISTDGSIDISDVILCLRMAIGLNLEVRDMVYQPPYPDWLIKRADLTGDDLVDISDVVKVLRKAIGLD
ncbi:MAG: FG-GAP-like repeat-containing protein [Candidatus Omnitrophica bacterium]|nr:FG-GAP-like repeat-containing protein [Candidatus Omnitrophota bacterium]